MCNVICLSFQVHPRTLLGAACCPLCWWVVSYRERAAAIDVILFCMYYIHSSPGDNNTVSRDTKNNAERISTVLLTKRLLSVQASPFVLHGVVLKALMSNALKDSGSVISMSLSFSLPHHKGELQRSCSRTVAEKVSEQCQLACHCRRYPPLPPPPPPPPPPRLLGTTGKTPSSRSQVSHLSRSKSVSLSVCSRPTVGSLIPSQTQVSSNWLVSRNCFDVECFLLCSKEKSTISPLRLLCERPCMGTVLHMCVCACDRASRMLTAEHRTNLCWV